MTHDRDTLIAAARDAATRAYAPYSNFHVGAALGFADGSVVTGANVENASYGLTLCAECGLVSELHATGGGRLVAMVCVDGDGNRLTPCGRCRQLLYEAGGRALLVDEQPILELLPGAFGPDDLPA